MCSYNTIQEKKKQWTRYFRGVRNRTSGEMLLVDIIVNKSACITDINKTNLWSPSKLSCVDTTRLWLSYTRVNPWYKHKIKYQHEHTILYLFVANWLRIIRIINTLISMLFNSINVKKNSFCYNVQSPTKDGIFDYNSIFHITKKNLCYWNCSGIHNLKIFLAIQDVSNQAKVTLTP